MPEETNVIRDSFSDVTSQNAARITPGTLRDHLTARNGHALHCSNGTMSKQRLETTISFVPSWLIDENSKQLQSTKNEDQKVPSHLEPPRFKETLRSSTH
jgi:hypothetical protein